MVSNIFTEVGGVDIFGKTFGKLSENFRKTLVFLVRNVNDCFRREKKSTTYALKKANAECLPSTCI